MPESSKKRWDLGSVGGYGELFVRVSKCTEQGGYGCVVSGSEMGRW